MNEGNGKRATRQCKQFDIANRAVSSSLAISMQRCRFAQIYPEKVRKQQH
jgi:hypothetical protein